MLGKKTWVIPEGYIPAPGPHADNPALISHETASVLNAGAQEAKLEVTVFFADRDPVGPYYLTVPAMRTLHLRFDKLKDPQQIPRETEYSSVIKSSQPIVVQHTRLDARSGPIALMSAAAFGQD